MQHVGPLTIMFMRIVTGLLLLLLGGCERAWTLSNERGVRKDVRELLARGGASKVQVDCSMQGTTRGVVCAGTADARSIEAIVSTYRLVRLEASDARLRSVTTEEALLARGEWFGTFGRPKSLHLDSGRQFEFLVVRFDPVEQRLRLFVSYAYG